MSKENLVKLLQTVAADQQLQQQWHNLSSYDEVRNLAQAQGFDLGDLGEAEAKRTINSAMGAVVEELSHDELDRVAGGAYDLNPNDLSIKISGDGKSPITNWLGKNGEKNTSDSDIGPVFL